MSILLFPVVGRRRSPGQFLRCGRMVENPRFAVGSNFSDICHTVGYISTSGLDGHIAISGYPSMSHLFVDNFFKFGVVDNFVYRTRITVILSIMYFVYDFN